MTEPECPDGYHEYVEIDAHTQECQGCGLQKIRRATFGLGDETEYRSMFGARDLALSLISAEHWRVHQASALGAHCDVAECTCRLGTLYRLAKNGSL